MREAGSDPATFAVRSLADCPGPAAWRDEKTSAVRLVEQLAADPAPAAALENPPPELAKLPPQQAAALAKLCLAVFQFERVRFVD